MSRSLNSDFSAVSAGTGRYASKGEDKDCSNISHDEHGLPDFGSFGVYDGHYGSRSSSLCAQHLNPAIMARMKKMEDKLNRLVKRLKEDSSYQTDLVFQDLVEFLLSEDMRDAMLVESIRASTQIMDYELRKVDKSGTTAVSLFVRKHREGEALRILVSNIGDSRCVLFAPKKGTICKNASSASLSTVDTAETKYDEGPSSLSKLTGTFRKLMKHTPLGGGLKRRDAEKLIPFCSTRDHSLAHAGERLRVSKKSDVNIDWSPFPVEALDSESARGDGMNMSPVVHIVTPPTPVGSPVDQTKTGSGESSVDGDSMDESHNGVNEDMISYDDLNQSLHFDQDVTPFQDGTGQTSPKIRSRATSLTNQLDGSNYSPFGVPIGSPKENTRKFFANPIPIPSASSGGGRGSTNSKLSRSNDSGSGDSSDSLGQDPGDGEDHSPKFTMPLRIFANSKVSVLDPLEKPNIALSRTPEEASLVDSFFCGAPNEEGNYYTTNKYIMRAKEIMGRTDFPLRSIRTLLATATLYFLDDENEHVDEMGVKLSSGTIDSGVFQYDPRNAMHHGSQTHRLGLSEKITPVDVDVTKHADLCEGYRTVRSNSFISSRVSSSGVKGPEALFGRFKISVSMTRSLGGRYGPRRCICLPDVIGMDVLPGQRIRCVLATDGLWDVVSLASIAKVLNKHQAPTMAAKFLTEKALKRREDRGLRLDDITVVVVDVQARDTEDITVSTSI